MKYSKNPLNGDDISILAYGCMRFPRDEALTEKLILRAIEAGVNYFDTAYIYPGSEATLGRILEKNGLRDSVYIATKLPPYFVKTREDIEKIFQKQLTRLKTQRIDYYLVHMLLNSKEWERLKDAGIVDWLESKKRIGAIGNFGFSYHGGVEEFKRIIDAHPWDFTMIQYNYFDEHKQAGREGLSYAAGKGMPVMVMEPLRGGKLATRLPADATKLFEALSPRRSPAEWALRWVWNQPEVTTLLSGMNSMQALEENIAAATDASPAELSPHQLKAFAQAKALLASQDSIACTGCNYCMPCPAGVDIPLCFSIYNDAAMDGGLMRKFNYIVRANGHNASLCVKCGACEKKCPQKLKIVDELERTKKMLEGPLYKPARFLLKKIMKLK